MIFSEVRYQNKLIGYSHTNQDFQYFFGTAHSSIAELQSCFPNLSFFQIKQVHGDTLVHASSTIVEADAQWTEKPNGACLIATADCIPILISHNNFICSIHAGWRGVANEILIKSISTLLKNGIAQDSLKFIIGPHIQYNSFEVDVHLAQQFDQQFLRLGGLGSISKASSSSSGKAYVDLKSVVQQQLVFLGITSESFIEFPADTLTDSRFSSFRRQKEHAGRNLSFVSRLRN